MRFLRSSLPLLALAFTTAAANAEEFVLAQPSAYDPFLRAMGTAVVFAFIGLGLFGVTFLIIGKVSPFCIRKEIEEDQNSALAIVMGAVILGIAIIVAASIHG